MSCILPAKPNLLVVPLLFFLLAMVCPVLAGSITNEASLRLRVPENALAYVRIPSAWGVMSSPMGNSLDVLARDKAYQDLLQQLRKDLFGNMLQPVEVMLGNAPSVFLYHLQSPIELMVLPAEVNAKWPWPQAFLTAKLDVATLTEFKGLWTDLTGKLPMVQVSDFDSEGRAEYLIQSQISLLVQFNEKNQTVSMLSGSSVNGDSLKKWNNLPTLKGNPIQDMEAKIDQSGHGLFAWINPQYFLPWATSNLDPQVRQWLHTSGIDQCTELALGWGVSQKKGRLKWLMKNSGKGSMSLLPDTKNTLNIQACGEPGMMAMVSIPFRQLGQNSKKRLNERLTEKLGGKQMKDDYSKNLKTPVGKLLDALGPELVFFMDDLGEYMAVRINDQKVFDQWIGELGQLETMEYAVHERNGLKISHLSYKMPEQWLESMAGDKVNAEISFILGLVTGSRTHLYWVKEGDFLVLSRVPQMLTDRQRFKGTRVDIGQWLREKQGQVYESSAFVFSTRFQHLPRHIYYSYINMLTALADLSSSDGSTIDLPSALDLQLPASGTFGLQIDANKDHVGSEMIFESQPLELLFCPQAAPVLGAIGLSAGIVLPALVKARDAARNQNSKGPAIP